MKSLKSLKNQKKPKSFWPFERFVVKGESMLPTISSGQKVLVYKWARPKIKDVIVCKKGGLVMVKRIYGRGKTCAGQRNAGWMVRGDNPSAGDGSLDFGEVEEGDIVGKVIAIY